MTREEFGEALLRLGAKLERWPRPEAEAARHLVASDQAAAKMLAEFAGFERTIADAVTPPPFGAAEIGAVLAALDGVERTWMPTSRFWLAGAGASALSFAAGVAVMLAVHASQSGAEIPAAVVDIAVGQGNFGGLL
jgi:hypothetical protein